MFPGRSTFFIFYDQNRPANGSPFGRAGAKRLRGQGRGQKGYLMINGVIFDMDGLMFDTERMWATFWEPALAALGLPYKKGLSEAARGTAGETLRNVVRQFYGQDCDAAAIVERIVAADAIAFATPITASMPRSLPRLLLGLICYCNSIIYGRRAPEEGGSDLATWSAGRGAAAHGVRFGGCIIGPKTRFSREFLVFGPIMFAGIRTAESRF